MPGRRNQSEVVAEMCRIIAVKLPEISASIRRMALTILQRDKTVKDNIRGKRLRAAWDEIVLDRIWAAFSKT